MPLPKKITSLILKKSCASFSADLLCSSKRSSSNGGNLISSVINLSISSGFRLPLICANCIANP